MWSCPWRELPSPEPYCKTDSARTPARRLYAHHQAGSHATLKHPSDPTKRVTVPVHARELPRGTLMAIVKQAGMTPEEFSKHL
ncbi:MAG: type II toxin-antitoxin system HicA family toxin [Planctomycetes bacterium]|nr:type II toxin-antitoxin system HicA family toxin [Planctomycetota bacterium]